MSVKKSVANINFKHLLSNVCYRSFFTHNIVIFIGISVVFNVLVGCQSNSCKELCDLVYQLEFQCAQFKEEQSPFSLSCQTEEDQVSFIRQQIEYKTEQCKKDYTIYTEGELSACSISICFKTLLDNYYATEDGSTFSSESHRFICREFRALRETGNSSWCNHLILDELNK